MVQELVDLPEDAPRGASVMDLVELAPLPLDLGELVARQPEADGANRVGQLLGALRVPGEAAFDLCRNGELLLSCQVLAEPGCTDEDDAQQPEEHRDVVRRRVSRHHDLRRGKDLVRRLDEILRGIEEPLSASAPVVLVALLFVELAHPRGMRPRDHLHEMLDAELRGHVLDHLELGRGVIHLAGDQAQDVVVAEVEGVPQFPALLLELRSAQRDPLVVSGASGHDSVVQHFRAVHEALFHMRLGAPVVHAHGELGLRSCLLEHRDSRAVPVFHRECSCGSGGFESRDGDVRASHRL